MENKRRTLTEIRDSVKRKMTGHVPKQSDACYRIANENFADLKDEVYRLILSDGEDVQK